MQSSTTTTLFPQQQRVLNQLPEIQGLLEKYQRSQDGLTIAENNTRHFIVRVPLIGKFSSGKSTILNALIGENIFATNVDPETAVPAELSYSAEEAFIACYPDGKRVEVSRDEIKNNQLSSLHPNGWIEAKLSAPELATLPHLRLVDFPGWGSGNNKHGQAIDNYSPRSLAYCLVVSAGEGTLNETTHVALNELKLHNMPVIVIISKCDGKTTTEIDSVTQQVSSEVEKLLGVPPLAVVKVSARKHDLAELKSALATLEQQAEALFEQNVVKPLVLELKAFAQFLHILINKDDLTSEAIVAERITKAQEMQEFNRKLADDTQRLEASLPKVLSAILRQVQDRLTDQLDSLTNQAEAGQDLQKSIEYIVRLAVTQGIRDEFDPKIQSYFNQISSDLPQDLQLDLSFSSSRQIKTDDLDNNQSDNLKKLTLSGIGFLLTKHPVGVVIMPILMPILAELFNLFRNKADREIEAAQRRENIRQTILGKIPHIVSNTDAVLSPLLTQYVENAQNSIVEAVKGQRAALDAALTELDVKLKEGKAAYAAAQQQYQADQQVIHANITLFENV